MKKEKNLWDDPLSALIWWYDLAIFALMFPSNSIIVFFRTRLGYRLMKPWVMGLVFLFLASGALMGYAVSSLGNSSSYSRGGFDEPAAPPATGTPLLLFSLTMGLLAIYHRRRGWNGLFDTANPLHSMARGDSYLYMATQRIAPRLSEYHVQRYIEPTLVVILGLALARIPSTAPLGMWLFVSGVALAGIEALVMEKALNDMLDRHDQKIEASMIEQIDRAKENYGAAPVIPPKTGGVTISPELARLRAARIGGLETHAVVNPPADTRQTTDTRQ